MNYGNTFSGMSSRIQILTRLPEWDMDIQVDKFRKTK